MATMSNADILRIHVATMKQMLLTDEFCRTFATTSRTTKAAVSELEYRWAAKSFDCLRILQCEKILDEREEWEDEDWLDNWWRNEEVHYDRWTSSFDSD